MKGELSGGFVGEEPAGASWVAIPLLTPPLLGTSQVPLVVLVFPCSQGFAVLPPMEDAAEEDFPARKPQWPA